MGGTMKENPKIKRWELSLSPMGMVHLHYETLLSNVLQDGMGGLARELHQLADELNHLASTRETPVAREPSSKVVGLPTKVSHPSSQ
jgi:hypothetical protein